jgi:hypothetical protein
MRILAVARLLLYDLRVVPTMKHCFSFCCVSYHIDLLLSAFFLATGIYVTIHSFLVSRYQCQSKLLYVQDRRVRIKFLNGLFLDTKLNGIISQVILY